MIIEYHRPETLTEALELLARSLPVTVPLGGGTVLSQKRKPDFAVVDLQKLGLSQVGVDSQQLFIGATTTLQNLYEFPDLPGALGNALRKSISHECSINQRRSATVAGTLVSCDGRSTFATTLLAADARLLWAPGDESQAFGDFLPLREPFGHERLMLGLRVALNLELDLEIVARSPQDRPIVCASVARWPSGRTRVALGGHGIAPILAMDGPEPEGAAVAAREAYRFAGDEWASSHYRMDVAEKLVQRLLSGHANHQGEPETQ